MVGHDLVRNEGVDLWRDRLICATTCLLITRANHIIISFNIITFDCNIIDIISDLNTVFHIVLRYLLQSLCYTQFSFEGIHHRDHAHLGNLE